MRANDLKSKSLSVTPSAFWFMTDNQHRALPTDFNFNTHLNTLSDKNAQQEIFKCECVWK